MAQTNPLPQLPINFDALADVAVALFSSVISKIVPIVLILLFVKIGLNWLVAAFEGKTGNDEPDNLDSMDEWQFHSQELFDYYEGKLDSDSNAEVPEWVRDRIEFEEFKEKIDRKEKERRWREKIQSNDFNTIIQDMSPDEYEEWVKDEFKS